VQTNFRGEGIQIKFITTINIYAIFFYNLNTQLQKLLKPIEWENKNCLDQSAHILKINQ